jgi:hypothetical protein
MKLSSSRIRSASLSPLCECLCPLSAQVSSDRLSQLYKIQGSVIAQLYGSNMDSIATQSLPSMIEQVLSLEQGLAMWRNNLFPQLQNRPWDALNPTSASPPSLDPVFDKLSVVIALRYLNTRILLHRPVLSALLEQRKAPNTSTGEHYLTGLAEQSVTVCRDCALEVIQIVWRISTSRSTNLLGAWWFSAYYSKFSLHVFISQAD